MSGGGGSLTSCTEFKNSLRRREFLDLRYNSKQASPKDKHPYGCLTSVLGGTSQYKISASSIEQAMSHSVRDASLTTQLRRQRALAAFRTSVNFPVQNSTIRPEQPNTQTGDVPTDARFGCTVGCTSTSNFNSAGYSFHYGSQSNGTAGGRF